MDPALQASRESSLPTVPQVMSSVQYCVALLRVAVANIEIVVRIMLNTRTDIA